MDQAGHKEIIITEPGYAKPPSKQMGAIVVSLCQMTTNETVHKGLSSIKRIFKLRSWIQRSCSRLEFKAAGNQDSHEIWEKQLEWGIPGETGSFWSTLKRINILPSSKPQEWLQIIECVAIHWCISPLTPFFTTFSSTSNELTTLGKWLESKNATLIYIYTGFILCSWKRPVNFPIYPFKHLSSTSYRKKKYFSLFSSSNFV